MNIRNFSHGNRRKKLILRERLRVKGNLTEMFQRMNRIKKKADKNKVLRCAEETNKNNGFKLEKCRY